MAQDVFLDDLQHGQKFPWGQVAHATLLSLVFFLNIWEKCVTNAGGHGLLFKELRMI
jgi:hypothetical protein